MAKKRDEKKEAKQGGSVFVELVKSVLSPFLGSFFSAIAEKVEGSTGQIIDKAEKRLHIAIDKIIKKLAASFATLLAFIFLMLSVLFYLVDKYGVKLYVSLLIVAGVSFFIAIIMKYNYLKEATEGKG